LEIIRKKLQARYFKADGRPTNAAYFQVNILIDGNYIYLPVESFDVEILSSFDGKPEYFLVTYKPVAIGYTPGVIIGNKYYLLGSNHVSNRNNPFEERGIEKGNRYYMKGGAGPAGFAFIKDGAFTDLYNESSYDEANNHIYSEKEIEERLQFLRSSEGIRFMKNWGIKL
jgi:hypothetical protein